MTRRALAAATLAVAALAPATPALACTIDTCWYTQPVCNLHVVECYGLTPLLQVECVRTIAGSVCRPHGIPPIT